MIHNHLKFTVAILQDDLFCLQARIRRKAVSNVRTSELRYYFPNAVGIDSQQGKASCRQLITVSHESLFDMIQRFIVIQMICLYVCDHCVIASQVEEAAITLIHLGNQIAAFSPTSI